MPISEHNEQDVTRLTEIADATTNRMLQGMRLAQDLLRMHRAEKNVILETTIQRRRPHEEMRQQLTLTIEEMIVQLDLSASKEEVPLLDTFKRAFQAFRDASDEAASIAILAETPTEISAARELSIGDGLVAYNQAEAALQVWVEFNDSAHKFAALTADDAAVRMRLVAQSLQDFIALQRAEKDFILATSTDEMEQYTKEIEALDSTLQAKVLELIATSSGDGAQALEAFRTIYNQWLANNEQVRALSLENSNAVAQRLSGHKGQQAFETAMAMDAASSLTSRNA